jgi:retron-type reverse transcriptase
MDAPGVIDGAMNGPMFLGYKRCWVTDWVIDLDIKDFFDAIPNDLVERAVADHTDLPWVRLYFARGCVRPSSGLTEPTSNGQKAPHKKGVVSPLLANLFLHYAFDLWIGRNFPNIQFERYADDTIVTARQRRRRERSFRSYAVELQNAAWSFRRAPCVKSARCVRRGGGWKRGTVEIV